MPIKEAEQAVTVLPDQTDDDETQVVTQSTVPPISGVTTRTIDPVRKGPDTEKINLALAGALHDQRSLLGVIMANATFIAERMGDEVSKGAQDIDIRRLAEEIKSILEEIQNAAYECAQISDDGLTFNRSPHGITTLKLEPLDLHQTISGLVHKHRKDVKLRCAGKSPVIFADRMYLERLIMNLIINAQKHSRSAETTEVWIEENDEEIRISVKDHGLGLSSGINDIFKEPHHQNTHETAGYGLGLRICKMICDSHNWCIQGKNNSGEPGAQFIVHISKNSKRTTPNQE